MSMLTLPKLQSLPGRLERPTERPATNVGIDIPGDETLADAVGVALWYAFYTSGVDYRHHVTRRLKGDWSRRNR